METGIRISETGIGSAVRDIAMVAARDTVKDFVIAPILATNREAVLIA
jgi:hypothetical protein